MTFNHGVEGSSPSALTKTIRKLRSISSGRSDLLNRQSLCGEYVGNSIAAGERPGRESTSCVRLREPEPVEGVNPGMCRPAGRVAPSVAAFSTVMCGSILPWPSASTIWPMARRSSGSGDRGSAPPRHPCAGVDVIRSGMVPLIHIPVLGSDRRPGAMASATPTVSSHQRTLQESAGAAPPCYASPLLVISSLRSTSKMTAVDQPNSSTPFIAVIGPSKCQRCTGVTSP